MDSRLYAERLAGCLATGHKDSRGAWHRRGDGGRYISTPMEERLAAYADGYGSDGCWLWTGRLSADGYAAVGINGKTQKAHRASYELFVGPIPKGLTIDHLCNRPSCINPAHLQPATNRENILRGNSYSARNARKTHCPRGHPLSGPNLYLKPSEGGRRRCRTCHRAQSNAFEARRKAARSA